MPFYSSRVSSYVPPRQAKQHNDLIAYRAARRGGGSASALPISDLPAALFLHVLFLWSSSSLVLFSLQLLYRTASQSVCCLSSIVLHVNGTSNSVESMPQISIHFTLSLLTFSICLTGPALLAFMLFSCPLGVSGLPFGG